MAKRTIIPPEGLSKDTQAFFDVLNQEPDFSVVVVAAAYLDASLAALLHRHFLESSVSDKLLASGSGALGTFAARADVSYVAGLISKPLYRDLTVFAEIRNRLAHHHLTMSFAEPELASLCAKLTYALTLKNGNLDEPMFEPGMLESPRVRYTISAVLISQRLLLSALGAERVAAAA